MIFHPSQYFKSEDEMSTLFNDYTSALENISNIVQRCNFKFPEFKYHLPKFSNPTQRKIHNTLMIYVKKD